MDSATQRNTQENGLQLRKDQRAKRLTLLFQFDHRLSKTFAEVIVLLTTTKVYNYRNLWYI